MACPRILICPPRALARSFQINQPVPRPVDLRENLRLSLQAQTCDALQHSGRDIDSYPDVHAENRGTHKIPSASKVLKRIEGENLSYGGPAAGRPGASHSAPRPQVLLLDEPSRAGPCRRPKREAHLPSGQECSRAKYSGADRPNMISTGVPRALAPRHRGLNQGEVLDGGYAQTRFTQRPPGCREIYTGSGYPAGHIRALRLRPPGRDRAALRSRQRLLWQEPYSP